MIEEIVEKGNEMMMKINEEKFKIIRFEKQVKDNMIKIADYRFR